MDETPLLQDDGLLIDEVGTWAEEKYRLVALYAALFAKSMRAKWSSLVYLDLFAGAGRVKIRNTTRIFASSPIRVLDVEPHFDRFIFCEMDVARADALKERCDRDYPDHEVRVLPGNVNQMAQRILDELPDYRPGQGVLAFCFVDPCKMSDLRFETLAALADRWMDFLVLIPSEMDAQRAEHRYRNVDNLVVDEFLGDSLWRDRWTKAASTGIRFEQFIVEEFGCSMERIGRINPGLATTFTMRNSRNRRLYRLVLYSKSKLALKFWKQAQKYANPNRDLFDGTEFVD